MNFRTETERLWAGKEGDDWIDRNINRSTLSSKIAFFANALKKTRNVSSVIEFGANMGANFIAIGSLFPNISFTGVEINENAVRQLRKLADNIDVFHQSVYDYDTTANEPHDLALTSGLLMYVEEKMLNVAYEKLYNSTGKYILICEYYDPNPSTVKWQKGVLYRRDFAGELMDKHPGLELIDYGFVYHRDAAFPMDDITWFLLEKDK